MDFKYPELLYALFLLVIPILVHLFQLRKFRQEKFTNVKFLKKASLQTRKSSRIKKWLVLCTRLFLLASVIIAFAQPFVPSSEKGPIEQETVIYLDNSYSMQAKGKNGILLRRSVQDLLENLPPKMEISLFSNNSEFKNTTIESLRKDLQQLAYSPEQLDWKTIKLKAEDLFTEEPRTRKNLIVISDFQDFGKSKEIKGSEGTNTNLVQLKPESTSNISVDTAYISERTLDKIELTFELRASGEPPAEIPVAVHDAEELLAKKTVPLDSGLSAKSTFILPLVPLQNGKISIEDAGLNFDNELFFSINEMQPINVVAINNADASFLERIFKSPDYELQIFPKDQVDYASVSQADLVILNELNNISPTLSDLLDGQLQENLSLLIIPSEAANLESYNSFFQKENLPSFLEKLTQEKLISNISYDHPLYESTFNEEVENFQYPKVQSYFRMNSDEISILSYGNGQAFLYQKENIFVFTAAINQENSNFQNSPLIVPTLFNIGKLALSPAKLFYEVGKPTTIDVKVGLEKDEILKLVSPTSSFIPLQQNFYNKVEVRLERVPDRAGHYNIMHDSTKIKSLGYNITRTESSINYKKLEAADGLAVYENIPLALQQISSKEDSNSLWKWFVIFALFFLFSEMLILKYFK